MKNTTTNDAGNKQELKQAAKSVKKGIITRDLIPCCDEETIYSSGNVRLAHDIKNPHLLRLSVHHLPNDVFEKLKSYGKYDEYISDDGDARNNAYWIEIDNVTFFKYNREIKENE
jgi:hypothetical protein